SVRFSYYFQIQDPRGALNSRLPALPADPFGLGSHVVEGSRPRDPVAPPLGRQDRRFAPIGHSPDKVEGAPSRPLRSQLKIGIPRVGGRGTDSPLGLTSLWIGSDPPQRRHQQAPALLGTAILGGLVGEPIREAHRVLGNNGAAVDPGGHSVHGNSRVLQAIVKEPE